MKNLGKKRHWLFWAFVVAVIAIRLYIWISPSVAGL